MEAHIKSHARRTISRAIRWGLAGAVVGAGCATLYGVVFDEVEILLVGAVWRLLPFVGYFAFCGLVAGGLTGAAAGVFNDHRGAVARSFPDQTPESNSQRKAGTV